MALGLRGCFLPWIKTREDIIRFANTYLATFGKVRQSVEVRVHGFEYRAQENTVVRVVNDVKGIDGSYLIKSIGWPYPAFVTEIKCGEYSFEEYEARRSLLEKVHNLEQYLTRKQGSV